MAHAHIVSGSYQKNGPLEQSHKHNLTRMSRDHVGIQIVTYLLIQFE